MKRPDVWLETLGRGRNLVVSLTGVRRRNSAVGMEGGREAATVCGVGRASQWGVLEGVRGALGPLA